MTAGTLAIILAPILVPLAIAALIGWATIRRKRRGRR